jgi:putative nucleotidyltransferase with HDIG domain
VSDIIGVINDPRSNAMDLKEVIEIDPPLTARVLKLANSVFYAPPKRISEIRQAILWIGSEALKELALGQKVCQVFLEDELVEGYSRVSLWKHSVAVGLFGRMLYRREFGENGENAYVAGLLHDIGIIVEDQFLQEHLKNILNKTKNDKTNLPSVEDGVLGFTHADIGMAVSNKWGFPKQLAVAIGYHHNPCDVEEEFSKMAATLYVADYACQKRCIGYGDSPFEDEAVFLNCLKTLDVKPQAIDLIVEDVEQEILRMKEQGVISA